MKCLSFQHVEPAAPRAGPEVASSCRNYEDPACHALFIAGLWRCLIHKDSELHTWLGRKIAASKWDLTRSRRGGADLCESSFSAKLTKG